MRIGFPCGLHQRRSAGLRWPVYALVMILVMALPLALNACTDSSASIATSRSGSLNSQSGILSSSEAPSTKPGAEPTPAPAISAPSGTLRLFCTARASLNPLTDSSASFFSVSRLVYEGLYRINGSGAAEPVLARTATVSADGLTVDIALQEGRLFHDGKAVSAQDVAASYNILRSAGPASAYSGTLPDISIISAVDPKTVRITLVKPQPDFAWQLVFPVAPAAVLALSVTKPMTILPGTGPYAITGYQAGTGLTLASSERVSGWEKRIVKKIQVREYKDRHEAMRAFERDEIDLIGLAPSDYPSYAIRNGLRLERYWSGLYVFLSYNMQSGSLLGNASRLAFIKTLSQDPRLLDGNDEMGIYPASVPVLPDSIVWSKTAADDPNFVQLYQGGSLSAMDNKLTYPTTNRSLVILAPEGDTLRMTVANRLSLLLKERKIVSEVRILPAEAFLAARQSGQYDILIAQAVVPGSMDPRWLLGPVPDAAVAGSELLPRTGLAGYPAAIAAVDSRYQAGTVKAAENADMAAVLRQASEQGPFTGIGFRYAAICSGNRVQGQVRPQINHLYEGIEELWIWSTLSS